MQDILLFLHNHFLLTSAFLAVVIVLVILEFIKNKQNTSRLSPAQAVQLINHQNAVVVDIRSPELFADGHIVDAVSLPLTELEQKVKKLDKFKSQPLLIVCAAGQESLRAAAQLTKQGFQPVILAGGLRAWREASMPVVKG